MTAPTVTRGRPNRRKAPPPTTINGRPPRLTDRQRQLVAYMAEGLTNEEIAERMFISVNTVKTHMSRVALVLDTNNRTQMVALALRCGLIS